MLLSFLCDGYAYIIKWLLVRYENICTCSGAE